MVTYIVLKSGWLINLDRLVAMNMFHSDGGELIKTRVWLDGFPPDGIELDSEDSERVMGSLVEQRQVIGYRTESERLEEGEVEEEDD